MESSSSASAEPITTTAQVEEQIVLACEVPENAAPGSTFHVQLDNRFFEVMTPEGAVPGQTIHIVVPAAAAYPQINVAPITAGGKDEPQKTVIIDDAPGSPNANLGVFTQLRMLQDRALDHAKTLNDKYKITEKVGEIAKPGTGTNSVAVLSY
jgi:hypothetical protein